MIYVLVPGHTLDFTAMAARGTHVVMSAISALNPTQLTVTINFPCSPEPR